MLDHKLPALGYIKKKKKKSAGPQKLPALGYTHKNVGPLLCAGPPPPTYLCSTTKDSTEAQIPMLSHKYYTYYQQWDTTASTLLLQAQHKEVTK